MMRARFALCILGALALSPAAYAADFLGPESCKACHAEAYYTWKQSKHAHALDSLTPVQQKDARCLTCHAPNQQEQNVSQVSCETCHGGGQFYSPSYVMKDAELARLVGLVDPSEKACRTCHDASSPSLKPFNFAEKLKLMDHWTQDKDKQKRSANATPPPAEPRSRTRK